MIKHEMTLKEIQEREEKGATVIKNLKPRINKDGQEVYGVSTIIGEDGSVIHYG